MAYVPPLDLVPCPGCAEATLRPVAGTPLIPEVEADADTVLAVAAVECHGCGCAWVLTVT